MAYLVLALGALLSIGGALSIFHGAGIVEVERGWTGVIAGATSLTGGIITIALGLILKTLLEMRRGGIKFQPDRALEPRSSDLSPAASAKADVVEPDLEGGLLAAFLAPKHDPVAGAAGTPALETAPREPQVSSQQAVPEASTTTQIENALAPDAPTPAVPARSRFRISFKTPAEVASPPPAPVEDQAPAMDDWLDRAFSSLDNEPPGAVQLSPEPALSPHHQPHPDEPAAAQAPSAFPGRQSTAHDLAELEPPPSHPRDLDEPAPSAAAPAQSAVIGRYEADGTSYLMFADGSIEAQSEAGVYRFNSMTELKAFIEGTS